VRCPARQPSERRGSGVRCAARAASRKPVTASPPARPHRWRTRS
jgi:hypothetical protein